MKDKNKYLKLIQNEYMKLFKYYLRSVFQVFIKTIIRDGKARFLVLLVLDIPVLQKTSGSFDAKKSF
jgi:hypothetical protein